MNGKTNPYFGRRTTNESNHYLIQKEIRMITNPAIQDMRSEGPLKPNCAICDREFRVWHMKRKMPCGHIDTKKENMDDMCAACTRRTIAERGMDPAELIVDY